MLQVPADPFRALIAHCLGSSRPLLNARSSHAPESDVKDAKRDSEVDIALPSDLLELIVQHLPRSDHAAARLTCRDMEKLIAPMLRMLFIKDWDISISTESATAAKPGVSCKWAHVQHLDLLTEPQWPLLQAAISRLPNLTHLRINTHLDERLPASFIASGALAGLTRLDLGRADAVLPPGMQLPKLLALSFGGCYGRSAAAISVFAPNLQELFCERLSFTATDDAYLPHVTHFGACHMYVSCSASKWAGQRSNAISSSSHASGNVAQLQPLLPSLRVLYRLPEISATEGAQPLLDLASPAFLQAVKGIGGLRNNPLLQQLQQLTQLTRLALHSQLSSGLAGFAGVVTLTSLQAVRLTGSCSSRGGADAAAILSELRQLPKLQEVALPVELLCSSCCPEAADALYQLAGKRGMQRLVFLQLAACGPMVERPHRRLIGCECPHSQCWPAGLALVEAAAAAAAALAGSSAATGASASSQCNRQQLQQQQQQRWLVVEVEAGEVWMGRHAWAAKQDDASGASGVWGEYGPAGEW